MPKTKTRKKVPARTTGFSKILKLLNPNSPKKKFLIFIAAFIVIGGGFMAYKSFAATTGVAGVYWPQQMNGGGGAYQTYSAAGLKKDTVVMVLDRGASVKIQPQWEPVIWAKWVRVCANVYNRSGGGYVNVELYPTFDGSNAGIIPMKRVISGHGSYQRMCSDYVHHYRPNAKVGATVVHNPVDFYVPGNQIHVASISVEYSQ